MPAIPPDVKQNSQPRPGGSVVVFGAGRIGRGFLGHLLSLGGCRTTFVDADAALVARLNTRRAYPLRLVGSDGEATANVENISAVVTSDTDAVASVLGQANFAMTAVGGANLAHVAPLLAAGLRARTSSLPLNVLLCENQWHAAALMQSHLDKLGITHNEQARLALVETVVGRMVPVPPPSDDPLLLVVESFAELPFNAAAWRGPLPDVPGLIPAQDFEAYEARKLYLHNGGHAALAYLGALRSYTYIWECAADPAVVQVAGDALSEALAAVSAEYGLDPDALAVFCEDLMARFASRALNDTVARVAADPLRKLRPDDRLVGAANLCLKHGIMPCALAEVIAAALRYVPDAATDDVLREVCRVTPESALGKLVTHYRE